MDRKSSLTAELVALLRRELLAAEAAHRATTAGMTHEEAKPENDKDTRALEQSYLARGQAMRALSLRSAVAEVESSLVSGRSREGARDARAMLGALVTVDEDAQTATYWMAAHGGGARLEGGAVQVITPQSPLGRALVGKKGGDDCEVVIAGRTRTFTVLSVE